MNDNEIIYLKDEHCFVQIKHISGGFIVVRTDRGEEATLLSGS